MTVGERIKEKRIALNMSQDELAKKVGYKSRSSIQKIEVARDLPLRKVELMASALDTTPAHLMGWDDFIDEISAGQIDPNEIHRAIEMYHKYQKVTPKVQGMVDHLLQEANAPKANQ